MTKQEVMEKALFNFAIIVAKKRWPDLSADWMIAGQNSRSEFAKYLLEVLERPEMVENLAKCEPYTGWIFPEGIKKQESDDR